MSEMGYPCAKCGEPVDVEGSRCAQYNVTNRIIDKLDVLTRAACAAAVARPREGGGAMRLPPGLGMLLAIGALGDDRSPLPSGRCPECGGTGCVWRSDKCGKSEPFDDDPEDYGEDDWEPCLCGDLRCAATVRPCPRGCPQIADEPNKETP